MPADKIRPGTGIFVWYGKGSYFRPHWRGPLRDRGFTDIDLNPIFKRRNSQLLIKATRGWKNSGPGIVLMTVGEIPLTLPGLRSLPDGISVVFMTDDEWRFHTTGRYLAIYFDLVVTNTPDRVSDYESHGFINIIHAPYAANISVFRPVLGAKQNDVVLIGAAHPDRVRLARLIISVDLPIKIFGSGWDRFPDLAKYWGGFLSTEQMVSTMASANIVLNPGLTIDGLPQIKGRIFETAACRTFQITQSVPGLERYFKLGTEIETYSEFNDLIRKIRYFLKHDEQRELVADAGYKRVVADHSWERRLDAILDAASKPMQAQTGPTIPTILRLSPGGDERQKIESALRSDERTMLTFTDGTGVDDPDRVKLLAHGLAQDMANDIWMNIASFDVVDAKRRVVANANVKSIAGASPELLPSRSIMLSAKESVELLPSGPISQQTLLSTVVPALIERGKFNHIDLDTGLFEEQAHGKYSIPEIYRRSVEGLWDVRTRPYASEVIRNVAVADGIRLAAGIVRRWESRRTLRAL